MAHDTPTVTRTSAQHEYYKQNNKATMQKQVVNFAIMIFLTLVAFSLVGAGFSANLVLPIILLMAGVQVVLQLYSFMHMEEKTAHEIGVVTMFMWTGMFFAFLMILAFVTIIWWNL
ncbi:cytochrome c oxidase subunit 4B [Lysinibacillus alkalisoli]|uniref:Cytochrome c oxidase subunit 4B n=1 Tax=Lysinibacillus alkalisoli TaxID=1911548 RepID=A0A917LGB5_9BACI|nr:cytochrome C oxidase subunit IV family protein [Lysinibacillus alkalisoli]GGG20831.1 cytochrome c oxidase subunit 4B [Lysinibacillus alkalisoli]